MLQAWIMAGAKGHPGRDEDRAGLEAADPADRSASDALMALLDDAGFTSVVATNCDQHTSDLWCQATSSR